MNGEIIQVPLSCVEAVRLGVRHSSTAVVGTSQESFAQKTWRWWAIRGLKKEPRLEAGRLRDLHVLALKCFCRRSFSMGFRKWHSRRAFILDLDPPRRGSMAWA